MPCHRHHSLPAAFDAARYARCPLFHRLIRRLRVYAYLPFRAMARTTLYRFSAACRPDDADTPPRFTTQYREHGC